MGKKNLIFLLNIGAFACTKILLNISFIFLFFFEKFSNSFLGPNRLFLGQAVLFILVILVIIVKGVCPRLLSLLFLK